MNHFGHNRISYTRIERHHIIVKVENVGPRPEHERERLRYKENVYYKYLPFWFGLNVCVYAFEILMTSNKHVCVCRWISPIDNVQVCSSDVSIFLLLNFRVFHSFISIGRSTKNADLFLFRIAHTTAIN